MPVTDNEQQGVNPGASTIAALDAMEENLRRFGLNHDAAIDPLKNKSLETTDAYMTKIRAAKDERRRLRQEKEFRRYKMNEQQNESDRYLNSVAHSKQLQAVVERGQQMILDGAKTAKALVRSTQRQEEAMEVRQEQLSKADGVLREIVAASEAARIAALPTACDCDFAGLENRSYAGQWRQAAKHDEATKLCERVVHGLVELCFRVSDNRFLPAPSMEGKVVRRVEQDLQVSQWAEWTRECVLNQITGDLPPAEEAEDAALAQNSSGPYDTLDAAAEAEGAARTANEKHLAQDYLRFMVEEHQKKELGDSREAVLDAVELLCSEGERLRKVAMEGIRERYDSSTEHMEQSQVREEVLPQWSQRMPPAACFVHGDDLSGTRLLCDTVERMITQQAQAAMDEANASCTGTILPSGKPAHESGGKGAAASVPTQPPLVGVSKTVGDVKRTYITPRTIMGQAPNKSGGHANVASATKSRQGGNRASNRRLSNDEEDRRELEALADALSREIFSAHMHNLHVLSEGKVPMTTTLNPPTEVHPPKRGSRKEEEKVVEAKPDEHAPPPPLHCLFLLGFPEVEYFYQLLEQKLSPAIESMEIEVVSEWHRKQQEAAEASSPGNRNSGRALGHHSPRPPPKKNNSARSKGKGNQPSMEDASNALVALHAKKSFPPLCIIGHFLTYDIPTRQQRLKDAFIRPFHPSGTATAPSQGHATIQSTPSTLHHNIFSPENAPTHPGPGTSMHLNSTISSVASLAKEKEPKDAGGSASGLSASTTAAVLAFFSRSKVEKVCDTWDVSRLRKELMTQDKRMHAWQRGWQLAFSNTSLSTFKKATAINNALKEKPNKKKSTDRKPAHGAAAHATNDSSTSIGGKLSTSVPETPGSNTKEAFVFPKVLFFYRLEDISATKVSEDVLDQFSKEMQEEAATGANTLRFVSQSLTSSLTSKAELQRGLWVNYLVHRMGEWAIPSRRVFTNESLTMKQLPAPLRLGDYRLPAEVCMELISTHNLYRSRLIPELKSPHEDSTNGPSKLLQTVFHDCATKGSTEAHELALRCELELQRSFMGYVLQVDSTLSQDAFPPQLWSKRGASPDFTSTMHYTSIDQNYEETKEYLETLCANANKTIHDRGAAMLRCAVDLGLNSLADALALLCEFVAKGYYNREIIRSRETHIPGATETVEKSFHPPNAASLASSRLVGGAPETKECGSISALTITGADEPSSELRLSVAPHPSEFFQIKEKFLSSVRRLSPDEARSLLDTLAEEEGDVSSLKRFWSVFDEYGRSIIEQAKDAVMSFIRAVDSDARSFHAQQTSVQTQSLAVESNASQAQDSTTKVPDIVLDGPRETTDDPFNLVALLDWDQLMPSLIDRIVSRTFVLLPEESSGEASDSSNMCPLLPHVITRRRAGDSSMRAIFQPQFVVEDPHSCPLINPNFCRAIVLTREIVQCFSEANIGGLEWLECMYRIALATPPGTGPYPSTTRPISLSELFNPPPRPTLEWEEPPVETRTTPRKRYPWEWRCLEIYLSAMSLFGRQFITESEFVYCASIFQLNVLWMFMDDDFAQLSARVGFPCHEPREPWPSMDVPCCPHRLRFWTEFQLHAPCRSSGPMWDIPSLLSPDELRRLFALHATVRFAGDKFTGPKVFLNVQNWCLDLVMRRCCFCSDVCCEIHRDVSVPEPCTKEVRHMMASFPSYVRSQRDPGEMVLLISPVTACAVWKRNNIQWWEFTPRGDSARWHELTEAGIILPNECTQSCATRVVSTYFSMTRDGLKNKRYAGLPLVLHLLAGFSGSVEGTVERMFHGLAALCYCKEKEKSSGPGVFCDPDGVGPMEADTLELSVEEFAFYFAQLASKGEGINEGVGRLVQPKPGDSEGIPLAEDTQLLLQVEGANSVSLPLLMSSHWGQTLLNAQFKG